MRKTILLASSLLAGCSATLAAPSETAHRECRLEGTDRFVGQAGTSEVGAAILAATHSTELRWAPPGYMLTMDFRADRVTVHLGPDYKITQINCG
jgi:hypothetical protein